MATLQNKHLPYSEEKVNELATLYKKNSSGSIMFWKVYVTQHVNTEDVESDVYLIIEHGVNGGKTIRNVREIGCGKQKRNKLEQAIFEAKSKWKAKVEKEGCIEDISKLDGSSKKPLIIKPMLAKTFDLKEALATEHTAKKSRKLGITFPAHAQRKYDGLRCLVHLEPETGQVLMQTRNCGYYAHFDVLKEKLKLFYKQLNHQVQKYLIDANMLQNITSDEIVIYLDGELYSPDLPFETLNGVCRAKTLDAEKKLDMEIIEYHIYDLIIIEKELPSQATFVLRNQLLRRTYEEFMYLYGNQLFASNIKLVKNFIINNPHEIKTLHDQFVSEGFEGIMLRNICGKYGINKRSSDLQKYKEFMEDEFEIVDFTEATGDDKGTVMWTCALSNGTTFSVRPRGTRVKRKEWFQTAAKYIGAYLTVIFQEYTANGIPRFPVGKAIRWDK